MAKGAGSARGPPQSKAPPGQGPETKSKKQLSILGVHLEASEDGSGRSEKVPIFRGHPILLNAMKEPFLIQNDIKQASVVDSVGGFSLRLQFDRRGSLLLEQ